MKLPITKIQSQKDPRWGDKELANSIEIEYYGCLVTCISMVACFFGKNETPSEVVEKIKKEDGLDGNGNYYWGSAEKSYEGIKLKENYTRTDYLLRDGDINNIKDAIDEGSPVMVWLDYNPKTAKSDMHWVLIIGYNPSDENDFTIADPIDGQEKSLKKYLGWWKPNARRTIEAYVVYSGKNKNYNENRNEEIKNLQKQLEKTTKLLSGYKEILRKIEDLAKINIK